MTREAYPEDAQDLHNWIRIYTGVKIARRRICRGHTAPFAAFSRQFFDPPDLAIWHASRGSGKSFLSALDTHLTSRWYPGCGTRILGGSLDQSRQIYSALKAAVIDFAGDPEMGNDARSIESLLARTARYANGSEVAILAASPKSVRGAHVPRLKLDEVDEIDEGLRDDSLGMNMKMPGVDLEPSALCTSTWHRPGGPMGRLMDRAADGEFPSYTWCVFEVLERCSKERSGRWVGGWAGYENCPRCPIKKACHADRDENRGLPRAKRSDGHYSIASLIQKAKAVGFRTFASDYECKGPKTEGLIYPDFDPDRNVNESAAYDPRFEVYLAVDSGVRTGAVWFQVIPRADEHTAWWTVHVFGDYYTDGLGAKENARAILAKGAELCGGRRDKVYTDPAGNHRTSIGPVVIREYQEAGLWPLEEWPSYSGSVRDGIALVESFIKSGDETVALVVHPRCVHTIRAFQGYERNQVNGQWTDNPKEPQHPQEELMDSLRGGLHARFPEGRRGRSEEHRVPANKVF